MSTAFFGAGISAVRRGAAEWHDRHCGIGGIDMSPAAGR
jgi:hypothetical protein